jgi:hypothetical protein
MRSHYYSWVYDEVSFLQFVYNLGLIFYNLYRNEVPILQLIV